MYLLDTDILSAMAPTKRRAPNSELSDWMRRNSGQLHLSVVTIAEIEAGIARAHRIGASTRSERLRLWLTAVEQLHGERILPFGRAEAGVAGEILDRARAHDPGFEDIAIAATAMVRGFTVLTANVRHFAPLGARVVNPLRDRPA